MAVSEGPSATRPRSPSSRSVGRSGWQAAGSICWRVTRRRVPRLARWPVTAAGDDSAATLLWAKVLFVRWRQHTNTIRLHSALGYRPCMANNPTGTKLGAASIARIISLEVVPFKGGRSKRAPGHFTGSPESAVNPSYRRLSVSSTLAIRTGASDSVASRDFAVDGRGRPYKSRCASHRSWYSHHVSGTDFSRRSRTSFRETPRMSPLSVRIDV